MGYVHVTDEVGSDGRTSEPDEDGPRPNRRTSIRPATASARTMRRVVASTSRQ